MDAAPEIKIDAVFLADIVFLEVFMRKTNLMKFIPKKNIMQNIILSASSRKIFRAFNFVMSKPKRLQKFLEFANQNLFWQ